MPSPDTSRHHPPTSGPRPSSPADLLQCNGAQGSKIVADHLVILDHKVLWLDNATTCPTARSFVSAAARSRRAALNAKENQKHAIYDAHAASQQASFFALINETGGAVNKEWHLLHKMLLNDTDASYHAAIKIAYRRLMTSVSCLTAKGCARSIAKSLRRSQINNLEQHSSVIIAQG